MQESALEFIQCYTGHMGNAEHGTSVVKIVTKLICDI